MARLTPLSKGLIGLAVVGAMASALWNLALKERFATTPSSSTSSTSTPTISSNSNTPTAPVLVPAPPMAAPPSPSEPPPTVSSSNSASSGNLSPAEHAEMGRKLMESQDFAQARGHLEQAVKGGDAGAACHLGDMTLKGQGGIAANQEAAAKLFQLAQSRNAICFAPGQ
ncbi:hypothetical protein [Hydrogenophaga sp.]|uniref:hypothetical protein n=1 Tax=Hydrogenophaga sp. TaxID=1904254 RepID=UPI002726D084|nr:hypothetical protein [Hydrogenophaga sp.]MDO9438334.1 hypothetical protein [Hydrogenophaga sp.]